DGSGRIVAIKQRRTTALARRLVGFPFDKFDQMRIDGAGHLLDVDLVGAHPGRTGQVLQRAADKADPSMAKSREVIECQLHPLKVIVYHHIMAMIIESAAGDESR